MMARFRGGSDQAESLQARMERFLVDRLSSQPIVALGDAERRALAESVAEHVHSFLQIEASSGAPGDEGFDPASGLAEPTPECRRVLNTWLAKCVFGPPK